MPAESAFVAKVACPDPFSAPVPNVPAPSLKVTVPVGVPAKVLVTVAVKVTDWPRVDGFKDETTAVLVVAPTTLDKSIAGDVETRKLPSPL